jgi:protein gp37
VSFHDDALMEPLRWRKLHTVFVNSMSDLAHARINDWQIAKVFAVMAVAHRHQFQILTKRPRRLAKLLSRSDFRTIVAQSILFGEDDNGGDYTGGLLIDGAPWPLPNVWIGTSIESDDYCSRADALRAIPAAVRFLSVEPLLGPLRGLNLQDIDWVIVGGESGPRHRRLDLDWVRDIRDRCVTERIPFFFKQVGGVRPKSGGRLLDGRTWDEMPTGAGGLVAR